MKSIVEYINESNNGGIGSASDIILFWDSDYDLSKKADWLVQSMLKKETREKKKNADFKLSREELLHSSTIATMTREALRKYSVKIEKIKITKELRNEVSELMTDKIFDLLDDYRQQQ